MVDGRIYLLDENGKCTVLAVGKEFKVLAENTPSYQLEMTREQVPDMADTLRRLVASGIVQDGDLPELKELKQALRDRIAPDRSLGHSDRDPERT